MAAKKKYVISSVIKSISYDAEAQDLIVEFKSGGKYKYSNVEEDEFQSFTKAVSKGKFFNKNIKDGYEYDRIASLIHGEKKMEWLKRTAKETKSYEEVLQKVRDMLDTFAHSCNLEDTWPDTLKPAEKIMKICGWED
jgi:hypothetical protein